MKRLLLLIQRLGQEVTGFSSHKSPPQLGNQAGPHLDEEVTTEHFSFWQKAPSPVGAMVRPTAHCGFGYLWREADVGFGTAFLRSVLNSRDALWVLCQYLRCRLCRWLSVFEQRSPFRGSPSRSTKRSKGFAQQLVVPAFPRPAFSLRGLVEIQQIRVI